MPSPASARELAALVGDDGGEQLALRALAAQQRRLDLVGERQRVEHLGHRRVEQRVGDREQADREERLALLGQRAAGEHLAHAGAAQARGRRARRGTSGIAEIAITVAQRRTVRMPSSVSASRTEPTVRGSAKKAELT